MNSALKISKTAFKSILFTIVIKIATIFKVSFIMGTYTALFSASSMIIPLSGAFGGIAGALATGGVNIGLHWLLGGLISFKYLAYHIPGIVAALYWANPSSYFLRIGVPILCMISFISNPIGTQAWPYSLFWLIPIAIACTRKQNHFLKALTSTFIAHAIGSALWVYTVPMTPSAWISLIPLVVIERLVIAAGMVVMYKVFNKVLLTLKNMCHTLKHQITITQI